jgi:hypothetical protein
MEEKYRFMKKIVQQLHTDGTFCWIWNGAKDSKGYGRFGVNGINRLAHAWAYETFIGAPKEYLQHTCGNNDCVNPAHLCEKKNAGRKPRVSPDVVKELKANSYSVAQIAEELKCSTSLVRKILRASEQL